MEKTALTPTDYAQAWALTHYLAQSVAATSSTTSRR